MLDKRGDNTEPKAVLTEQKQLSLPITAHTWLYDIESNERDTNSGGAVNKNKVAASTYY